jgi:hypothetical protein
MLGVVALGSLPVVGGNDWDVDLRGGFYVDDVDGPFVGGGGLTRIGQTAWFANPNVEVAFGDDLDLITVNADFHYDFDIDSDKVSLWVGGGPTLLFPDHSGSDDDDDVDIGLNGLFGVGAARGKWRPFGQAKIIVSDETELVLMGGVRF